MSSQDTLNYAKDEEQSAKALQSEIEKQQAKIAAYLKDAASNSAVQENVDEQRQILTSLQEKQDHHYKEAERLTREGMQERQHEQEEQLRQQHDGKESLLKRGMKEIGKQGLFD